MRIALLAFLAVGSCLVTGCAWPGPPARVGQGPDSARIVWLRQQALEQVREWYAGSPRHVAANFEAADRFFEDGDVREAKAAYERIIGWFPSPPHRRVAEFWIAYCHEVLGERGDAMRLYRKVVRTSPEKRDLWADEAAARVELLVRGTQ